MSAIEKNKVESEYGIIWNKLISSVLPTFAKKSNISKMINHSSPPNLPGSSKFCKSHYEFWDMFIDEWKNFNNRSGGFIHAHIYSQADKKRYKHLTEWTYPVCSNKLKAKVKDKQIINEYYSSPIEFLPEPWWGNDGMQPLSAVVINLNPGSGVTHQTLQQLPIFHTYSDFIGSIVDDYISNNLSTKLNTTSEWHYLNRALPIFDALELNDVDLKGANTLRNILSLEMVPWHTPAWNNLGKYPSINASCIFDHTIRFAAEASRSINNDKLRNCVLVRSTATHFEEIFQNNTDKRLHYIEDKYLKQRICRSVSPLFVSDFSVINFVNSDFDDVRFILIRNKTPKEFANNTLKYNPISNNNFSHCSDLIRIIKNIN